MCDRHEDPNVCEIEQSYVDSLKDQIDRLQVEVRLFEHKQYVEKFVKSNFGSKKSESNKKIIEFLRWFNGCLIKTDGSTISISMMDKFNAHYKFAITIDRRCALKTIIMYGTDNNAVIAPVKNNEIIPSFSALLLPACISMYINFKFNNVSGYETELKDIIDTKLISETYLKK